MKKLFLQAPFPLERGPWKTFDPFLFCVFHLDNMPNAYGDTMAPDPKHKRGRQIGSDFSYKDGFSYYHGDNLIGFPEHPHRQLSTYTITMDVPNSAVVDHFDSTGACGRYGGGDTQVMTASLGSDNNPLGKGKAGIIHSEMFPLLHNEGGNNLELFQIWVKVPNGRKYTDPTYKMLWRESTPIAKIPVAGDDKLFSEVKVIIGDYPNLPFPAQTAPKEDYLSLPEAQGAIYIIQLPKNGAAVPLPPMKTATANRAVYVFKSDNEKSCKVRFADPKNPEGAGVLNFRQGTRIVPDAEITITNEGEGNVGVLVLSAEPLNEPTQQYGPFVGGNMDDIQNAFSTYRSNQFGGWPWGRPDPTFPKDAPRQSIPRKGAAVEYPPGYEPKAANKQ